MGYFSGNFNEVNPSDENLYNLYDSVMNNERTIAFGRVQSGKTKNLANLINKITLDNQWIVIYLTGMISELKLQNKSRFKKEFINREDIYIVGDPIDENLINTMNIKLKKGNSLVINYIKQNTSSFDYWLESINEKINILIIDDEADEGSYGEKIIKDITTLMEDIGQMIPSDNFKRYLSITASPYRNLFFDKYNNFESFVKLNPYSSYKGQKYFEENYITKTKEEFESDEHIIILLIEWANIIVENKLEKAQLLFNHTEINDGQYEIHKKIYDVLRDMKRFDSLEIDGYFSKKEIEIAKKFYNRHLLSPNDKHFKRDTDIIVLNSDMDESKYSKEEIKNRKNYNEDYKIIVGGNKLSRGITFENLIIESIYYPIKFKYNIGTLIQKARWFGNRDNHKIMKIYMLDETREALSHVYNLEEWLMNDFDIKRHNLKEEFIRLKFNEKLKVSE